MGSAAASAPGSAVFPDRRASAVSGPSAWPGGRPGDLHQLRAGPFGGQGKIRPHYYLPPFCEEFAAHGLGAYFVDSFTALRSLVGPNTCIVHLFSEDASNLEHLEPLMVERSAVVFNASRLGAILCDKAATNRLLSEHELPVPAVADTVDAPVFSNAVRGTNAEVQLLRDANAELDPGATTRPSSIPWSGSGGGRTTRRSGRSASAACWSRPMSVPVTWPRGRRRSTTRIRPATRR